MTHFDPEMYKRFIVISMLYNTLYMFIWKRDDNDMQMKHVLSSSQLRMQIRFLFAFDGIDIIRVLYRLVFPIEIMQIVQKSNSLLHDKKTNVQNRQQHLIVPLRNIPYDVWKNNFNFIRFIWVHVFEESNFIWRI